MEFIKVSSRICYLLFAFICVKGLKYIIPSARRLKGGAHIPVVVKSDDVTCVGMFVYPHFSYMSIDRRPDVFVYLKVKKIVLVDLMAVALDYLVVEI